MHLRYEYKNKTKQKKKKEKKKNKKSNFPPIVFTLLHTGVNYYFEDEMDKQVCSSIGNIRMENSLTKKSMS